MKKLLLAFISLLMSLINISYSFSQNDKYLVVNPQGHTSQIRCLDITSDSKYVITGSFDKTIKVWDVESGEIIREFYGQRGPGSEGMIYTLDLSPDDKLLAVAGWLGKDDESEPEGDIRIYDFESGKLIYFLQKHQNTVSTLRFTSDSKNLITGDAEGNIYLWDFANKKTLKQYEFFTWEEDISCLATYDNMFVTGGGLGNVCLWNLKKNKPVKNDTLLIGADIDDITYSPDGKWIAASSNNVVLLYDKNLNPIQFFDNINPPLFIRFSPDSKKILCGVTNYSDHKINIYSLNENNEWEKYTSAEIHSNTVMCGAFLENNKCVTAGGENNEIAIWELQGKDKDPKLILKKSGLGKQIYAAAKSGNKLVGASDWSENFGMSKFNFQFDLLEREFETPDQNESFPRPKTSMGEYTLERVRVSEYKEDLNRGLILKKNTILVDTIIRRYDNGDRHNVFSFVSDKYFVSGGAYGILEAFNLSATTVSRFVGHTGDIWGLSVSSDGKYLISASDDQTIRFWELNQIGKIVPRPDLQTVWDYCISMQVESTYHKLFEIFKVDDYAKKNDFDSWQKVIDKLIEENYPCNFLIKHLTEFKTNLIYPYLSLFFANDGEWIAWKENGYYMCSKNGAKYVGYHLNQGKEHESKFYPFEQFDLKFNRPDILLNDLGLGTPKLLMAYKKAYQKRLKKMGFTEEQLSDEIYLPEVKIENYNIDKNNINLKIAANDKKNKLKQINIYLNDNPVFGSKGKDISGKNAMTINENFNFELLDGRNKVQVSVTNEKGAESLKETIRAFVKVIDNKPNLYIASIGVSDYENNKFNLKYAAKDAKDVISTFKKSSIFENVYDTLLINSNVNSENIKKLKSFLLKAKTNDIVILFVAGHGVLDEEMNYYFASYNMDFDNPSKNGIEYQSLESLLDGITAVKKLFLMDACHSGELDKDELALTTQTQSFNGDVVFRSAGVSVTNTNTEMIKAGELMKEMFFDLRRGTGATVISSAGGAEYAMESDQWNNGLFTYCFLNGIINQKADLNNDKQVMLSELQKYIRKEVEKLSKGKQKPTNRIENISVDYRIW